ncbi:MAG: hypothetical protein ACI9WO_000464 [Sphingobacteriales bacterium]|jgi:hypothetical protein
MRITKGIILKGITFITVLSIGVDSAQTLSGYSPGAPANSSGGPAEGGRTCNTSGCHTGTAVQQLTDLITSDIPEEGFFPGETYSISTTIAQEAKSKFGFQISAQSDQGSHLGTFLSSTNETKIVSGNYLTHTSNGTSGAAERTWNFEWTAPSDPSVEDVTFYAAFNAANNNNSSSGDAIFTSTLSATRADLPTFAGLIESEKVKIFPNPVNENLTIFLPINESVAFKIFSQEGRLIKRLNAQIGDSHTFNVSELNSGVYIIEFSGHAKPKTFIVQ